MHAPQLFLWVLIGLPAVLLSLHPIDSANF